MELREPPRAPERAPVDRVVRGLLVLIVVVLFGLLLWTVLRPLAETGEQADARHQREVAAKLQAAGALDEAAALYEGYLLRADAPADQRARIAFSLGNNYLDTGRYDKALRWFYEAETLGAGELGDELASRIVHCLDSLGRHHAAQAVLERRVQLEPATAEHSDADPVVARIGQNEIRRSEVLRTLDMLPAELAASFAGSDGREELLRKFVADELLWRKAVKLEYDRDPKVEEQQAAMLKQLAVSRFVEKELLPEIKIDDSDLRNFFAANKDRYRSSSTEDAAAEPTFEQVRPVVERDYRMVKLQSAYESLIDSELSTQDVEMYPERMTDGS